MGHPFRDQWVMRFVDDDRPALYYLEQLELEMVVDPWLTHQVQRLHLNNSSDLSIFFVFLGQVSIVITVEL